MTSVYLNVVMESDHGGGKHIVFSPNPQYWVCVWSNKAFLWQGEELKHTVQLNVVNTSRPRFSPDGKLLYAGTQIHDLEQQVVTNAPLKPDILSTGLDAPASFEVHASAWSPDVSQLLTYVEYRPQRSTRSRRDYTGIKSRLLLLDGQSLSYQAVLAESTGRLGYSTLAFHTEYVVAGGLPAVIWNRDTHAQITELAGHDTKLLDICFSPDGASLLTADWSGTVVLRNAPAWNSVSTWQAHPDGTHALAFHPERNLVATGGTDRYVKLWDVSGQPAEIASLQLSATVVGVGFHPSDPQLHAADELGNVIIADIDFA